MKTMLITILLLGISFNLFAQSSSVEFLSPREAKSLGYSPAKQATGFVVITFEGDFSNKDKIYNTLRSCSELCNFSAMWGVVFKSDYKAIWYGSILASDAGKIYSYDLVKYLYGMTSPGVYGQLPGSQEVVVDGPSFRVNQNGKGIEFL